MGAQPMGKSSPQVAARPARAPTYTSGRRVRASIDAPKVRCLADRGVLGGGKRVHIQHRVVSRAPGGTHLDAERQPASRGVASWAVTCSTRPLESRFTRDR